MGTLPKLKNSSYAQGRKYVIDAEVLNELFQRVLDSVGTSSIQSVIEATGQIYNPLKSDQLLNAIVQLVLSANYFKDIGVANNVILDAYNVGYGIPTQYINNMSVKFRPKFQNTGATRISFNNMSSVPLITDTYEELESGYLLPTLDFVAVYSEEKGAFILSSEIQDSGALAITEIRTLVESTGLKFSEALRQQLEQAVALYSLQQTYTCVSTQTQIQQNNYVLEPIDKFTKLPKYTNGICIRFRPSFSNTLVNPYVQVQGLGKFPLLSSNGDTIPEGSISTDFDVVVKYENEVFYLVSNCYSSIKLQNGPVVTSISNDVSLSNSSDRSLVTEYAVKTYVDSKVNAKKKYAVSSGKEDEKGKASFFEKTTDTVLTILAGKVGSKDYESLVSLGNAIASPSKDSEYDPEEEETITFGIENCFDGNNETYYETKTVGSDVAGHRDMSEEFEYDVEPCFIGATDLEEPINKVRILGHSSSTLPRSVFFKYSTDGVNWNYVGTETYQKATPSGDIETKILPKIYSLNYESGSYSDIDVSITPYVDPLNPELGSLYPYSVKCFAYEFADPLNGWQVTSYEFCKETNIEIPPLVLTYDDGSSEVISDKSTLSIDGITTQEAVVLKVQGGSFEIINSDLYSESYEEPINKQDGMYWAKLSNAGVETYLFSEDEDTGDVYKDRIEFVKLGTITIQNGIISELHPSVFNGEFMDNDIDLNNVISIDHNIGSSNTSRAFIVCQNPEGGYIKGDTVELVTQALSVNPNLFNVTTNVLDTNLSFEDLSIGGEDYSINCTTNPHSHSANSELSISGNPFTYRLVVSGYNTITVRYNEIVLPNKNNGNFFTVTPENWKLSVICSRSF